MNILYDQQCCEGPKVNYSYTIEPREREAGEITPASVEQSATKNNDDVNYGTGLAIDMDLDTRSIAKAGSGGTTWIMMHFNKVHCIKQVRRYVKSANSGTINTWTCEDDRCIDCGNELGLAIISQHFL